MGDVIQLDRHRAVRRAARGPRARTTFFFDLASPYTYLAAERADRLFPGLQWRPASCAALCAGAPARDDLLAQEGARAAAQRRAELLRLPLIWPEPMAPVAPAAMRVCALAAEHGRAGPFVLAASRLAFCGGFDVDDPEILAEAAAAAHLGLDECLQAAGDVGRDGPIERAGLDLVAAGADRLPVLRIGGTLFCGEERIADAAAAARSTG